MTQDVATHIQHLIYSQFQLEVRFYVAWRPNGVMAAKVPPCMLPDANIRKSVNTVSMY